MFLHGGRGAGTDNISHISGSNWSGSHVWIQDEMQAEHPAFVVAPQLSGWHRWDKPMTDELSPYGQLAVELIEHLQTIYPIDPDRVYLTGQSRGGWGVWDLIGKRSDLFAAAIPVCGGGDPTGVSSMRDIAVWVFHGARDHEVKVERSREMVEAFRSVGGDIKYSEYRFSGHAIWDRAYKETAL
ncbi:MAG: prolyl oligopeptidase family serine peptidase [Rhodothermales bacterium]